MSKPAWPVIDASRPAEKRPELAIAANTPRGALRVILPADAAPDAASSFAFCTVSAGPSHLVEEPHEPGFATGSLLEFYGIDAGHRFGYLECGGRVSDLFRVQIPAYRIVEMKAPDLRSRVIRSLRLEGSTVEDLKGATVLLQYDGFDLLRPWYGAPLELRSPLHQPHRVVVRAPDGPETTTARLGTAHEVTDRHGDITIAVPTHGHALVLAPGVSEPAAGQRHGYALDLSAGLDVFARGRQHSVRNVLAALRVEEFGRPPRAHTWIDGDPTEVLRIDGMTAGTPRVGVGVSRRGRYVLWREQPAGVASVYRAAMPSPPTANPLVLPEWIRTVDTTDPLGAGPRKDHRVGPGEIWQQSGAASPRWRRLVAWADGSGHTADLPAAVVDVARPVGVAANDVVRLTVRVPHSLRGQGVRFAWKGDGGGSAPLPPMPDGLLDGVVTRRGRILQTLHGVICGGQLLEPRPEWCDVTSASTDTTPFEIAVTDASGAAVAEAALFGEDGRPLPATNTEGRAEFRRPVRGRTPAFVSVRVGDRGFTRHAYAGAPSHALRWTPRRGFDLTWSGLQSLIGVDLESIGVTGVGLSRQPGGETTQVTRARSATIAPRDVLEFAAAGAVAELWGWFDEAAARGALGPMPHPVELGRTAEIVVITRATRRTIHVALPRTELRLGIGAGRQRRIRVAAPVRLSLLTVVPAGDDGRELRIDEGITAELLPDDVLVVTLDDEV